MAASPMPAHAQDSLTEEGIHSAYMHLSDLVENNDTQLIEYIDQTTSDDFEMISHDVLRSVGLPDSHTDSIFNKAIYIEAVRQSLDTMSVTKFDYAINTIEISADGKTAQLEDESKQRLDFLDAVTGEIDQLPFYMEVNASCHDDLILDGDKGVQMKKYECWTETWLRKKSNFTQSENGATGSDTSGGAGSGSGSFSDEGGKGCSAKPLDFENI